MTFGDTTEQVEQITDQIPLDLLEQHEKSNKYTWLLSAVERWVATTVCMNMNEKDAEQLVLILFPTTRR